MRIDLSLMLSISPTRTSGQKPFSCATVIPESAPQIKSQGIIYSRAILKSGCNPPVNKIPFFISDVYHKTKKYCILPP